MATLSEGAHVPTLSDSRGRRRPLLWISAGPLPGGQGYAAPSRGFPMPAPASTNDFIDLVRRSDLIDGERLEAFERALKTANAGGDRPPAIASRMVREGLL